MFSRTKTLLNDIQACRTSFAGPSRGPACFHRPLPTFQKRMHKRRRRRRWGQRRLFHRLRRCLRVRRRCLRASHSRRGGHAQCRSRNAMSLPSRGRRSAAAAYTRAERRGPAPCRSAAVPLHVARRRRAAPCRPPCRRASDRSCCCRAAPSFEEEAQGARCASQPRAGLRAHVLLLARECHGRRAAPD